MRTNLFTILASGVLLASCSSAYRTGQTPDDVYYSHGSVAEAEVKKTSQPTDNAYQSYWGSAEDDYLRMKVKNPSQWSTIDDLDYWYGYNNHCNCNTSWNMGYYNTYSNPWAWNSWGIGMGNNWYYNPYYNNWNNPYSWGRPVVVVNKFPTGNYVPNSRPSLGAYVRPTYERGVNTLFGTNGKPAVNQNNPSLFKSIFGTSVNNEGNTWSRPARTFSDYGSGSSGSSRTGGSLRTSGGGGGGSSSSSSSGSASRGSRN
jgi:hypothetical protein